MLRIALGLLIALPLAFAGALQADEGTVQIFEVDEILEALGEDKFASVHLWHHEKSASHLVHVRPGGSLPDHHHPVFHEAVVVLRGELTVRFDGEKYQVATGQVLYIPAGTYIEGTNEGDEDATFIAVFASTGEEGPLTVRGRPGD